MNSSETRPAWLWITAAATLVYLVVEFSFNARLLDVIGGTASEREIDSIQKWGRIISGFAFALAIWPVLIRWLAKHADFFDSAFVVTVVTVVIMFIVYHAEERLVSRLSSSSSAEQKSRAGSLLLLQQGLRDNHITLTGLDMVDRESPDAKAFIAVFPVLAINNSKLGESLALPKDEILHSRIVHSYGGMKGAYRAYLQSLEVIDEAYNGYAAASNKYADVIDSIPGQQMLAWQEYRKQLHNQRPSLNPETVPRRHHERVRRKVQAMGVPVGEGWKPNDRQAFDIAVAEKARSEADAAFGAWLRENIPAASGIQPGLSAKDFAAIPDIQEQWRKRLQYPAGIRLLPYFNETPTFEQFRRDIFDKVLERQMTDHLSALNAPPSEYEQGGSRHEQGERQVRVLIAPTLALTFSFLGAVVHIFKFSLHLAHLARGSSPAAWKKIVGAAAAGVVAVAIFSFAGSSRITRSELYVSTLHRLVSTGENGKATPTSYFAAHVIRAAINAQPALYVLPRHVRSFLSTNEGDVQAARR
ncbi:MAG TPA: hypothetical protein VFS24_17990 [Steroidobacteraceae bacterium]|nr:hypothetical protein [Steroidobacteraceae bacterium]